MPFVEVYLLPGSAQQLIFAATDVIVDNEETTERRVDGIPEH